MASLDSEPMSKNEIKLVLGLSYPRLITMGSINICQSINRRRTSFLKRLEAVKAHVECFRKILLDYDQLRKSVVDEELPDWDCKAGIPPQMALVDQGFTRSGNCDFKF